MSELVIHKYNTNAHLAPVIDGERKGHGLVPRDFSLYPPGVYGSAQAVDLTPFSDDDIRQRIKDLTAAKGQISDIMLAQNVPCLDQNGKGYSHDEDTECLTEKGWVRWPEWNHTDLLATVNPLTHRMEFQAATEWHANEYRGEMYHSVNRRLDFGVTNYHRMYVRKWDESRRTLSDKYTFQNAADLGWYVGLLAAPSGFVGTGVRRFEIVGDRAYDGNDFVALVALVSSCGYAGGSGSTHDRVSFCCFDESRRPEVEALARRVGFGEQPGRRGVWTAYRVALAEWFRVNCYDGNGLRAPHKKVPDIIKWLSMEQINHYLAWFGDKNHGDDAQPCFYSSSRRMVDDLQELLLRIGKRGTIRERGPRRTVYEATGKVIESGPSFVLTVSETDRLCIDRKKHIEKDHYKGFVYCATVPNGLLVTRRNGSVLISGNCWAHSTTGAIMALRAIQNEPTVELSAYAVACIIKNYRDEGGWGALSLDFITTRGVPSSAFWAQRSMDRANDNPATWENAAKHRAAESWADLAAQPYDRTLTFKQELTLYVTLTPCVKDENWWSHSILGCDAVEGTALRNDTRMPSGKKATLAEFEDIWDINGEAAGFGVRIRNSWGDSYGDKGFAVLAGQHAISDGCVAPRSTTPSNV